MKICPTCQAQYEDQTMVFCPADGRLLSDAPSPPAGGREAAADQLVSGGLTDARTAEVDISEAEIAKTLGLDVGAAGDGREDEDEIPLGEDDPTVVAPPDLADVATSEPVISFETLVQQPADPPEGAAGGSPDAGESGKAAAAAGGLLSRKSALSTQVETPGGLGNGAETQADAPVVPGDGATTVSAAPDFESADQTPVVATADVADLIKSATAATTATQGDATRRTLFGVGKLPAATPPAAAESDQGASKAARVTPAKASPVRGGAAKAPEAAAEALATAPPPAEPISVKSSKPPRPATQSRLRVVGNKPKMPQTKPLVKRAPAAAGDAEEADEAAVGGKSPGLGDGPDVAGLRAKLGIRKAPPAAKPAPLTGSVLGGAPPAGPAGSPPSRPKPVRKPRQPTAELTSKKAPPAAEPPARKPRGPTAELTSKKAGRPGLTRRSELTPADEMAPATELAQRIRPLPQPAAGEARRKATAELTSRQPTPPASPVDEVSKPVPLPLTTLGAGGSPFDLEAADPEAAKAVAPPAPSLGVWPAAPPPGAAKPGPVASEAEAADPELTSVELETGELELLKLETGELSAGELAAAAADASAVPVPPVTPPAEPPTPSLDDPLQPRAGGPVETSGDEADLDYQDLLALGGFRRFMPWIVSGALILVGAASLALVTMLGPSASAPRVATGAKAAGSVATEPGAAKQSQAASRAAQPDAEAVASGASDAGAAAAVDVAPAVAEPDAAAEPKPALEPDAAPPPKRVAKQPAPAPPKRAVASKPRRAARPARRVRRPKPRRTSRPRQRKPRKRVNIEGTVDPFK